MRRILLSLALAACTREPKAQPPPQQAQEPPPKENAVNLDALTLGSSESRFLGQVDAASAVFIGKLVEVGPPPGFYSGYNVAFQPLTYEVVRVLRGDVPSSGRLTVYHVIVAQSPALVEGKPELKPEHTTVGQEYVVALGGKMEGKQITANENVAPTRATPDFVTKVEARLAKP